MSKMDRMTKHNRLFDRIDKMNGMTETLPAIVPTVNIL
jgi:hypothetical protein